MTMVNFRHKFIGGCIKRSSPGAPAGAMLSAGDKGSCWIDGDRSWMQVALWLSQPFVTEPWIRTQRMERKIVCSSRQFDFMNMDRVAAVPHQDFLSSRFLLRRIDPYPDQQAVPFGKLIQSPPALPVESATYHEHGDAGDDKPAQY